MKLQKVDALFLYGILSCYKTLSTGFSNERVNDSDLKRVSKILQDIEQFFVSSHYDDDSILEDAGSEIEDENDEDEDEQELTRSVSANVLADMLPIKVTELRGGSAWVSAEFEVANGSLDLLLDGGSNIIENVEMISLHAGGFSIKASDDATWQNFYSKKKSLNKWTKFLELNVTYQVVTDEDE